MSVLLKKFRIDILVWAGLVLTYLATRLVNLGILPIFTDEAIYLRWSQIMAYDASLRYLPLVDGKPPLFMWLTSIVMKIFPKIDILLTGRLVSVFAGLGAMVGIYFASYQLFHNKKISYLSSIFYLLSSFTFFYDRFALADSLLTALGIWIFGLGILLVKKIRLDVALILGMITGLAFLTKTPALLFLVLLPSLLLLFSFKRGSLPAGKAGLLKLIFFAVLSVVLSQAIYSVLRLFPLFHMISVKNSEFTLTFSQLFKNPLALFPGNLPSLLSWEFWFLTPMVVLVAVIGVVVGIRKQWRETVILLIYFFAPLFAMAAINTRIYVRYLLPFTPVVLILAAVGLAKLLAMKQNKYLAITICVLVFAFPVYINFKLITNPIDAPIPQADRDQYIDGWAAGYGVKEVRAYLSSKSKLTDKMFIATEGTFGLMPYALELYKKDYPNLEIKPYWPITSTVPMEIVQASQKYPTYFLMYQSQTVPENWKLEEVLRFRQGLSKDYLRLYRVLP